jgi:hypothetical protein
MAAGWTAGSLTPRTSAGLSGLQSGSVTRGALSGSAPLNSTQNLGAGTGVPPFIQGALNPFLSAVSGAWRNQVMSGQNRPVQNVNVINQADILRAQNERNAQNIARSQLAAINWNLGKAETRLNQIRPGPTPIGDVFGPERAALQKRVIGLEGQIPGVMGATRPMAPMGGWSSTFAIPAY